MKFKSKAFKKAMEQFQYSLPDEAEIEIIAKEEDLAKGKICDCFTFVATYEEKPSNYDKNTKSFVVVVTVEVFAESENRLPRYSIEKSRELT